MKTRIEKEDVFEQVKTGEKNRKVYIADDGAEFYDKKRAELYQQELEFSRLWDAIPTRRIPESLDFLWSVGDVWYCPQTREQSELLESRWNGGVYMYVDDVKLAYGKDAELTLGEWYSFYCDVFGCDHRPNAYVYSLTYIKEKINKYLEALEG